MRIAAFANCAKRGIDKDTCAKILAKRAEDAKKKRMAAAVAAAINSGRCTVSNGSIKC